MLVDMTLLKLGTQGVTAWKRNYLRAALLGREGVGTGNSERHEFETSLPRAYHIENSENSLYVYTIKSSFLRVFFISFI